MQRYFTLLVVAFLMACGVQYAAHQDKLQPPTITQTRDGYSLASMAPGDTLPYTLVIVPPTTGPTPTSYTVTTTADSAGWGGMLTNLATVALTVPFKPFNLTAWGQAGFTACAKSVLGTKTSAASCKHWSVARTPGVPGVGVDSTQVIVQVILKPDAATLAVNTTKQFCPFVRALDGKVRFISGYENNPECQPYYDAMPSSDKLPGYPVAYSRHSTFLPITPGWVEAVRNTRDELAHIMFGGPFVRA